MPTGYTAAVAEGISFEQFVWRCARAMGALVMMREEPTDAPIPDRFEASPYYAGHVVTTAVELARLQALTPAEVATAALKSHIDACERFKARVTERTALRSKYEEMLAAVTAWTPPTVDHEGFKEFMTRQLADSIKWDCDGAYDTAPVELTPGDWMAAQLAEAERMHRYAQKALAEENERTQQRNGWLAALRTSLAERAK